jgi:hypothetical protein
MVLVVIAEVPIVIAASAHFSGTSLDRIRRYAAKFQLSFP